MNVMNGFAYMVDAPPLGDNSTGLQLVRPLCFAKASCASLTVEGADADALMEEAFDELLAVVREARPDINIAYTSLNRGGYFYVTGQTDNFLVRNRANKIYLAPQSGEIVYNQYGEDLSAYWYWSNMADPLHFGNFSGLLSRLIWFGFGLILSFLSLSGVWLFAKRLSRSHKLKTKAFCTTAALLTFSSWFILNAPEPFLAKSVSGFYVAQQLPYGTKLFLYSWLLVTAIINLSWVYLVFVSSRKKV